MCLISVCPKGTVKNSKEVEDFIKSGAVYNTDGSGFMFKRASSPEKVYIKKGYFDIDKMISDIKELNLTEDDELAIHHRTGTSGRVSAENTHPFIIDSSEVDEDTIFTTELDFKITDKPAMVHNGCFWGLKDYMSLNPDLSDTYACSRYVMPYLMDLLEDNIVLFKELTGPIIGSDKVCIIYPGDKKLRLLGNFINKNGYYHSNNGYCTAHYDRGGVGSDTSFLRGSGNLALIGEGFNIPELTNKNKTPKFHSVEFNKPVKSKEDFLFKSNITITRLDNRVVKINKNNYKDFYFRKKADVLAYNNDAIIKKWYLDDLDESSEFQVVHNYSSDVTSRMSGLALTLQTLSKDYFFTPMKDEMQYYVCLLQLINKHPHFSKNAYKDLEKLLSKNYAKKDYEFIRYKKTNKNEFKKTLTLYKDYLEIVKEGKESFKPILEALDA
jgi:hypothetical protein